MNFTEFYLDLGINHWNTISIKFNEEDVNDVNTTIEEIVSYIGEEFKGCSSQYLLSIGKHEKGLNERPHYHINICYDEKYQTKRNEKNESRRRKKYWKDEMVNDTPIFTQKIGNAKTEEEIKKCIMYPWKEGNIIDTKIFKRAYIIPEHIILELSTLATGLYEAKRAKDLHRQKQENKNRTIRGQLLDMIEEKSFSNYQSYKEFIYTSYYEGRDIDDYHCRQDIQKNIQEIAIYKKIVPYWYFDKA